MPSHSQQHPEPTPSNKRKKVSSPIPEEPMFPFTFRPERPLPPFNKSTYEQNANEIVKLFFNVFQSVLDDVSSFDELKKINPTIVKNKISNIYYNG